MHTLADDPTDIALMQAIPFLPVPRSGRSPAIDALTTRAAAHGYLAGADGVFLHLARPWLSARIPLTGPLPIATIYGAAGPARLDLLCGLIPGHLIDQAANCFRNALPNEAGGFITWHEATHDFTFLPAEVIDATPSRLTYRPPEIEPGAHIVADIHSHGAAPAFWSATDDIDDACHTRLSFVVGRLDNDTANIGEFICRLSACGVFAPIPKPPATPVASLAYRPSQAFADE